MRRTSQSINQSICPPYSFKREQTCGGHIFAWTPFPDVFSLRTFWRLVLGWGLHPYLVFCFLGTSSIPDILVLGDFLSTWLFWVLWSSSKPEYLVLVVQIVALDSELVLILMTSKLLGNFALDFVRSGLCLDRLNDFFNSAFAYWAIWWGLPILFGTGIATYLC